jgi:dTDP-4-dehydrorhamnose 3,5-epimerase
VRVEDLSIRPTRDVAQVTSDWTATGIEHIEGVAMHSINSVITDNGHLTEVWRADWKLDGFGVQQVFQRSLSPQSVSAWHVHLETTDRLFCGHGAVLVVLFDARVGSSTHGVVAEYRIGEHRPAVVSVPPGVVHGVKAIGTTPALLLNAVDQAYRYDGPDHHRLPADSPEVPYRF